MRLVYFGTAEFACPTLKALAADSRFEVALVVTQPDARAGRGLDLKPNAVGALAAELQLPLFQPQNINAPESIEHLKSVQADLFLTAAYGQKLSDELLALSRLPALNLHASLLPRHRGAAPIHRAILAGDAVTGVSLMRMVSKMDAGPVFATRQVRIEDQHTTGTLEETLADLARDVFLESANGVQSGKLKGVAQDESKATRAPMLDKDDGRIRWGRTAVEIDRHVRAMSPWPGAFTFSPTDRSPTRLLVVSGEILDLPSPAMPGTVVAFTSGIEIATKELVYRVLTVKRSGKKALSAVEFLRGFPIPVGTRLT